MTRPIVWATGTLIALALWGGATATRIAGNAAVAPRDGSGLSRGAGPQGVTRSGTLVLQSDFRGHYMVHSEIEGRRVAMMVDTGASVVALTPKDAAAAGYRPAPQDYKIAISTANGVVRAAPVRIREMRVGDIVVRDVEGVVVPGGLGTSLLGMSLLRRLNGFEMSGGRLTLKG